MRIIIICITFLLLNQVQSDQTDPINLEEKNETASRGKSLVIDAFRVLINGEPKESAYKDLFVDTSKSLMEHLEKGMDIQFQIPVDDMLKILVQTIIILVANRRVDIIPVDFNQRHPKYNLLIEELNKVLDLFATRGASSIYLTDFTGMFKVLGEEEVWQSINALNQETNDLIQEEAIRKKAEKKLKNKSKKAKRKERKEL